MPIDPKELLLRAAWQDAGATAGLEGITRHLRAIDSVARDTGAGLAAGLGEGQEASQQLRTILTALSGSHGQLERAYIKAAQGSDTARQAMTALTAAGYSDERMMNALEGRLASLTAKKQALGVVINSLPAGIYKGTAELDHMALAAQSATSGATGLAGGMGALGIGIGTASAAASAAMGILLQLDHQIAQLGADAVFMAAQLQESVALISTIRPDIDAQALFHTLDEMATRVPQTSKQLSDGLYNIFSSIDIGADDATVLLEKLAKGATAAGTDTQTFGTAVVGIMNAYKLSVSDADHISDLFFETVRDGVVNGQQLASSLGVVTQAAKNAGVPIDELFASIASVTREGGDAAQNINNLANLYSKITTTQAQREIRDLGIRVTDVNGNLRPTASIIEDLGHKLDTMSGAARAAELNKIFPDLQARQGAQTLMSQIEGLTENIHKYGTEAGIAEEAVSKMASTPAAEMRLAINSFKSTETELGEGLLPAIKDVAGAAKDLSPALLAVGLGIEANVKKQVDDLTGALDFLGIHLHGTGDDAGQFADNSMAAATRARDGYDGLAHGVSLVHGDIKADLEAIRQITQQFADQTEVHLSDSEESYREFQAQVEETRAQASAALVDLEQAESTFLAHTQSTLGSAGDEAERASIRIVSAANEARRALSNVQTFSPENEQAQQGAAAAAASSVPPGVIIPPGAQGIAPTDEDLRRQQESINKEKERREQAKITADQQTQRDAAAAVTAAQRATDARAALNESEAQQAATAAVDAAQKHLTDDTEKWTGKVNEAKAAVTSLKTEAESMIGAANKTYTDATKTLQDFTDKSEQGLHELDGRLRYLGQSMELDRQLGEQMLKPLIADADRAASALAQVQAATKAGDETYADFMHHVTEELYQNAAAEKAATAELDARIAKEREAITAQQERVSTLQDGYASEQAAVTALGQSYDEKLRRPMDELNKLRQQASELTQQKTLHDEGLSVDNLAQQLTRLTAGTSEYREVAFQLAEARKKQSLDARTFGLENQIAGIQQEKKEATDAANAHLLETKATLDAAQAVLKAQEAQEKASEKARAAVAKQYEDRKTQLQEEQALIDHARAEFDYEQHHREIAAQAESDRAAAALQTGRDALTNQLANDQATIDSVRRVREAKAYDDGEEERSLKAKVTSAGETLGRMKTYYDGQITLANDHVTAVEADAKAQEDSDKRKVASVQQAARDLSAAYQTINRLEAAAKAGAVLTPAEQKQLSDAQKALAQPIGTSLVDGMIAGAKSKQKEFEDTMSGIVRAGAAAGAAAAQANSPSRLTRDTIGIPMGEGVWSGALSQAGAVEEAMMALVQRGASAAGDIADALKKHEYYSFALAGIPSYARGDEGYAAFAAGSGPGSGAYAPAGYAASSVAVSPIGSGGGGDTYYQIERVEIKPNTLPKDRREWRDAMHLIQQETASFQRASGVRTLARGARRNI